MELFDKLKERPGRLAMPDKSEPTSMALTRGFYVRAQQIVERVAGMLGRPLPFTEHDSANVAQAHDVPGPWFSGPF
jgi:hypothetical protein